MAGRLTRAAPVVVALLAGGAAGWIARPAPDNGLALPEEPALAALLRDSAAPLENDQCFTGEVAPESGWTVADFMARYLDAVSGGAAEGQLDCTGAACVLTMSWSGPEAGKGGGRALRWGEQPGYACIGF